MLAYYYFLYSLSKEFSANPRCSSTCLPPLGPGYFSFVLFWPSLSQKKKKNTLDQEMLPPDEGSDWAETLRKKNTLDQEK